MTEHDPDPGSDDSGGREPVVLGPGEGRAYPGGRIDAVFKVDSDETDGAYGLSEWWLEARCAGPGPHRHPKDDAFYVLEGTMSIRVGERWVQADAGSFVLIPGGVTHDFENRSDAPARMLNIATPGGFEQQMPEIARHFIAHPPGEPQG
jgi:mannose-6-phosphate isomerase-like protein (cupin superfamily)